MLMDDLEEQFLIIDRIGDRLGIVCLTHSLIENLN